MSAQPVAVAPEDKSMEELVALCKRRGFVYPASEIYGGINGFWDYGPLGTQLKNNIRDWWWKNLVECPPLGPDGEPVDIVGLDSAIIQNPKTWEASGHVGGFSDPMVDCTETKKRYRADQVYIVSFWSKESRSANAAEGSEEFTSILDALRSGRMTEDEFYERSYISHLRMTNPEIAIAIESDNPIQAGLLAYEKLNRKQKQNLGIENPPAEFFDQPNLYVMRVGGLMMTGHLLNIPPYIPRLSPATQKPTLTEPREFNLMFETYVGAIRNEDAKAYLRPETAQGIFLNYKNVLDTMRVKVPFGVAQVGKAFRNEVTPRNYIFRSREFEQMEMEWFCAPDEAGKWYEFWKHKRMEWWLSLGINPDNLRFRDHDDDELAHYSKMCVDVEYKYPFTAPGFGELEGVAHRGCFDLTQHQEHSGTKMEYFDQARQLAAKEAGKSKEQIDAVSKYIPNVIEPASGLTRAVLVLLCEAFTPTPDRKGSKYILSFKPRFAPVKAGIFPLVNKDGMPEVAQKLYMSLREKFTCEYDAKQSIGKRYARMDEIGTPTCITIDGETLSGGTVTVRDRDTLAQERVHLDQVERYLTEKMAE